MTTVFQRVGPFEIAEELGRGGMAAVFLARDSRNGRTVALKLVPIRDDREHREILEAERSGARLQARLSAMCPLVPEVFEEGEVPPRYFYIAMEYVAGENLSDLVARGPVDPDRAAAIAIDLCRFLDAAHGFAETVDGRACRSLVHGDLKPRNVRIAPDGAIKVLDFGIAKALSLSRKVTRNDFGSMPYLSPERLDSVEVDAYADLWALGVILHEMLVGMPPFHARDTRRLEDQIRAGYGPRQLPDTVPAGLRAIVARLLAPSVEHRYASAALVSEDLVRFRTGDITEAQRLGWPAKTDSAATRRTRQPDAADEKTRRTRPAPLPAPEARPSSRTRHWFPRLPRPPRRSVRAALLLLVFFLVVNEVRIGVAAGRVAASAATRDLEAFGDVWDDYDSLTRRSYLGVGVAGLRGTLRRRAGQLATQVIDDYRAGLPSIRERQWKAARFNLQHALAASPDDRWLRAALRYCDGHINRIDGEAERGRRQNVAATRHFSEAITAFREAAELRSDWPDPFLGLARTFIYGVDDVERAGDALKQAEARGYKVGERETAQLADGYRARGARLGDTARQLRDLPQEPEYLRRSLDAYREAQTLYERIPSYPGVPRQLRRVHDAIRETQGRLDEIQQLLSPPDDTAAALQAVGRLIELAAGRK
jgi:serine/threonine protein kinase/tetratricopeptide (TPR) repeat protein